MTSTNDGSNLKSGQKDKRYYIESFQSLEARLNGPASTEQRTQNVCEAWRLVHGLCSHSTPDTHSHLLSWIQRNTANAILQDEWGLPENKPQHLKLETAINDFIYECHKTDSLFIWETTLLRRAVWYKRVLSNPWGHAVLKTLLDPKSTQPTDQEVISWLREERAMMFVTRLRVMARAKRLIDLALLLVSAVMTRARRVATQTDVNRTDTAPGGSKGANFVESLSREAGFTKDVWELLIDIEFVLLHKQDQSTCIDLAKKIPLKDGKRIVERLRFRLDKSPADKKLWKKAKDVAILIAQVVITRCMVVTSCAGAVLDALTGCASALAQLLDGPRLPQTAAALAAPAASAAHLYAFANAIAHQCKDKIERQPFICELYVRAITAGMNELERLKLEKDKEPEVCALQHTLSGWFTQLGEVLSSSSRLRCECLLTAFSLHPSANMYELVAALPPLATPDKSPKQETSEVTSEFGSWATDSRTSSNFVKTSETLNLKQTQKQTNILSSSMFDTECGALGLKTELCEDLAVLLSGPRVKTLSWDMDRDTLLENCRVYKERTQEGTRALTTELKYLNLDPKSYDHLPEEQDDEDNYYGIEKGYEYEEIWSDNNIDYAEGCESTCSISTVDSTKTSNKPKTRKNAPKYSDEEIDPLTLDTEPIYNLNFSEDSKKTSKKQNEEVKKKSKSKKSDDPESKKLSVSDQEIELQKKQKRKERRERKKREKMEMLLKQELQIGMDDNTSNLIGTNALGAEIEPMKERRKQNTVRRTKHASVTDSDYDSQGKSFASINSEANGAKDVLFDGLFLMDEIGSPEKTFDKLGVAYDTNRQQYTDKPEFVKNKLKEFLQFRHNKQTDANNINVQALNHFGNDLGSPNSNIYRPEVKSQVLEASPNVNICKNTDLEKINNHLKRSEKSASNVSNRNLSVAPSQKQFQKFSRTQAATSGLFISDPHQRQFQEFLKLQNIPITLNATGQNQPNTAKVVKSDLAIRNPMLTDLIQQKSDQNYNNNSVKDINNATGGSVLNSEILKLHQKNLPIVEAKKHLIPQKRGGDNVPNTFSRLSYMHKNKQADMKQKQLIEQEQVKTQMVKIIDNDSLNKINNLQAKGEIFISKAPKRNSAINRGNPSPSNKQGQHILNPCSSSARQAIDLRLNIVNVSKSTKEIVENKVIIKKDPKTMTPVDLQYLIHQKNLELSSNWKSQYPNTTIEKSSDVLPLNVGNTSNNDKVVMLGVVNKDIINDVTMQQENINKVIESYSNQYNINNDSRTSIHKEGEIENTEDWKFVMNKLISLKSEKKGIDALEMTLNRNANIKGSADIWRKYALSSKSIDSREHIKIPSKQKDRPIIGSKHTAIKNEIAQKLNQPVIVKKIAKKSISKTLKTNNVIMSHMHNSDYDQLDDLIDDELRQEIEESSPLNSEVDILYGASRVRTSTTEKAKPPKSNSSQEINIVQSSKVNYNMEQTSRKFSTETLPIPVTRTCSVIKENLQGSASKPKLRIISDQILPPYMKSSGTNIEKYCTKVDACENRSSVIAERPISYTQKEASVFSGNVNNMSTASPINRVHPATLVLKNVTHLNQVQNLMIIKPTNTISHLNQPISIIKTQLPLSNVNNHLLKRQSAASFSSPGITAQVVNLNNIGNNTTDAFPTNPLKSHYSNEHIIGANKKPDVISLSTLNRHKLCENYTKINSAIKSTRPKEENIQCNTINRNDQYDQTLKTNLIDGQALLISSNQIRDRNIDITSPNILEEQIQHNDELLTKNSIAKTGFIHRNGEIMTVYPKISEGHQTAADMPKSINGKSKYEVLNTPDEKIEEIESNSENIYKDKNKSPSILSEIYDQIFDAEFATNVGIETDKTQTNISTVDESRNQIKYVNFGTYAGKYVSNTEKDLENIIGGNQSYKENNLKLCVEASVEIDKCSDNRLLPKDVICEPQPVIIDEPQSKLSTNLEADKVYESEKNITSNSSTITCYNLDLPQNEKKLESSTISHTTISNMPTKFCERKVLSQVQETQISKGSEITDNMRYQKNKYSLDYKIPSDKEIERLSNKRLSIIHRKINHYIASEPIALTYAPIDLKKCINDNTSTTSNQNDDTGTAQQKLKIGSYGNETSKNTNAEESPLSSKSFIEKSNNYPTRLRSSNSFATSKCTLLDEFKPIVPNTVQKTNINYTAEVNKTAIKPISENFMIKSLTDSTVMKLQKSQYHDISNINKEINVNSMQKDINQFQNETIHHNSETNLNVQSAAINTIDLTDYEPTNNLQSLKRVSDCCLLNKEPASILKNTGHLDCPVENTCKSNRNRKSKKSVKEVSVTEINELPSLNGDLTKKSLRIKLSNGNIFRATVSGNLKVDIKTVLSEPTIKSLLTTDVLLSKSCTVNVKHIIDSKHNTNKNEVTVSSLVTKIPNPVHTEVIELSDDENENIYYFKTEFGTYKTKSMDSKIHEKHQNKFSQKCTISIHKYNVKNMMDSPKKSFNNIISDDIGSLTKVRDITNECVEINNISDNLKILDSMEQSEINSEQSYSESKTDSDLLKNIKSTLLESQIVQLYNVCRVKLARCDQKLNSTDINYSDGVIKEPESLEDIPVNEEDINVEENTLRSKSPSVAADLRVKNGSFLPSFDCCSSEWILCTKSTIHSLDAKIKMQQEYLTSMHDIAIKPDVFDVSKSRNSCSNLSVTENDKFTLRPDSPSIIIDFVSQGNHSSYSSFFDQCLCNSDWLLSTKASIHSLEINQQKFLKAVLNSHVNSDINMDSSTDCDSDLEFCDMRQKNEEQKIMFQVPSLLSLVSMLITSNEDIVERYVIQKNKAINSPTHNLKRKHNNMSDKRNSCKIFKTDENTFCGVSVPVKLVVENQEANTVQNSIREPDDPTVVIQTPLRCIEDGIANDSNEMANESNFDEKVVDKNDNTNTTLEMHNFVSKLVGVENSRNNDNLPVDKISEKLQTFTIKDNSLKKQLEINDQELKDNIKNFRGLPSQLQDNEKRKSQENSTNIVTTIQYAKNSLPNVANEENIAKKSSDISISKVLCETGFSKNIGNHEYGENKRNSEQDVSQEEYLVNNTNRYFQIYKINKESNDKQIKCNDEKNTNIMEDQVMLRQDTEQTERGLSTKGETTSVDSKNVNETVSFSDVLCHKDSCNNIDNYKCEKKYLKDNNVLKSNDILLNDGANHNNKDTEFSIINVIDEICNPGEAFEVDKNENIEFPKISEVTTIQGKSDFIPLIASEEIVNKSNLKDESILTSEYLSSDNMSNDKNYNSEQIVLEQSLITSGEEMKPVKLLKSSDCVLSETFENTMAARNHTVETTSTYNISHTTDSHSAREEKYNIIDDDQSNLQSSINKKDKHETSTSIMGPTLCLQSETFDSINELQRSDINENTDGVFEVKNIIETSTDNDSTKVENSKTRNNDKKSVTLIYKGNSNVVLKGSPYVDPVVGTCYIFPLSSSCSRNELTSLNANQTINIMKSLKTKNVNENDNVIEEQTDFTLILPKRTYSRFDDIQAKNDYSNTKTRHLKRKSDSKNDCKLEKKYRKGKNIDTCKQTTDIFAKIGYAPQFKRLLEYCTTINFSYSRPFHINSKDPIKLLKNWPIEHIKHKNYLTSPLEENENRIFVDIEDENKVYFDPLQETLAIEIAKDYNNEHENSQFSQVEDSNFNMGFGEGSDRVIQSFANGVHTSKISAATLSDVKLPQPSVMTRDKEQNIPQIIKKSNDEELAIMKRCISFIQLRDKVKDFFKKTALELHCNENFTKRSSKTTLCDLTSSQFFEPPAQVAVVNVVQVGQLPVSASAQNPVTCDPRVTHVSNASPPQCSADNSPDGDQNASKTEYTELTTADLSIPLVQDYEQSSQVIISSQSQLSVPVASKVTMDINCETKIEPKEEHEDTNENTEINNFLTEHKNISNISYSYNPENDSFRSANNSYKSANESYKTENDSYKSDSIHKTDKQLCKSESNAIQPVNSRTLDVDSQNAIFDSLLKDDNDYVFKTKTTNGTSEKTDQIAHAMNAAGITTGTDSISNNNRAHALVNILSQKIRQNTVNTTQASVNSNYTKGSPINAMALQQALAQILPPPLNQTNSSEHQSAPITPQVLHIVQGKNTSGNQITIVDNQQNSVINNSTNPPVLHIVQNKSAIGSSTSNPSTATQNNNSFSGLSLVDAGIQQGGNQLLHIVNTGGQKNSPSGQLLKRVNLLTNLTNVQGSNEQKMVQFVCKSADGKSIQLNAPHQRSMVLRLQPIESTNVPNTPKTESQEIIQSPNFVSTKENNNSQHEIKSRSVYEENYAKFIQNSSPKPSMPAMPEKSTSLPKFNQAFGKQVYQDNNQKNNEMQPNSSSHSQNTSSSNENVECSSNDNAINLEHINQINSPPLLLRKSPAQTSQSQQGQSNLVQQIKQTMAPVNIQTMHGGVIYTRQIPVNIGGGQTINLITVPSTDLIDETGQKQQSEVKFVNQNEIEPSIIKIVPQSQNSSTSEGASEDNNVLNATNDTPHTTSATHTQPVLTQMRIKLPMLSKTPQMVSGARLVRPSFFQIQRNVIGGANQPVYQQLVLTAAPSLGQQSVRPPQAQPTRVKTTTENQTSSESQMSSSTLEQLREFDMVLEQVKERSTVQPNSNTNSTYSKLQSPSEDTESNTPASVITTEPTQQVLYSIGNNNSLNVSYVNKKPATTTSATTAFARSPDSSGVADSPTSSTHVQIPAHSSSNETSSDTSPQQSQPKPKLSSKSKSRPKTTSNPTTSMKINTVPPKTSTQKPLEDEQTTQRILYILAEYKEQVENSPDKDKPAPRRRSNPPSNPGSSKRKKSSSGSRRPGGRDMSPIHGEDTCRTMGSEDSSCGTSQGDCTENCLETHSPQDSPRKVARKLTFENETSNAPRQQPARNVIVADGQTITVARGTAGKPATAVLMPANYILPVSMVKGGQQIAIVTNRGPKILTVGGEGGGNALLLQRLIGPAGLKPMLARPGVRHVRLPTAALHNLQAFNIATAANVQPPDSTASPAPAPTPPDLVETRATSSPWPDRDTQDVKPERSSSPEGSEPWNLPSSADHHDYSYEETVRAENLDRTVLDAIPDRYSPDLEAQRIFDKMFDVDTKKSFIDSQDNSPRCGYDIDTSDCDDKGYQQVVQKRDQRQHRLAHVSAAALRHKYAILEHELRLQKSLSEECEDLGVDSPSAAELFPEAELLFASSPAHESSHHGHTPQPGISQSTIPQPDMDDQIATDQLLNRTLPDDHHQDLDVTLGLDEGIVTVSEDGMQATITLDQEEFARSHPNTTFHSEPTEEENVQPYTISGIKGRHITSTIFHAGRAPATVLMTTPQTTVISQAAPDNNIKYIDNIMNPAQNICLSSVLVKDDGLTKYDNILNDSRELHLSNTASAIVHSNAAQVIRRVCYDDDKRDSRFLLDETDALIAGDDAKMIAEDSSRDATLESIADDRSSPERHTELFWESNSASERSDSRRPLDFSSDSDKCCKSPPYDETNSTDSSGVGSHTRLDSVIKDARGLDRSGSADNSSADDTLPPLRTYPPKRMYHVDGETERSVSGKTRAGERSPDGHEVRRRASVRGVVKRGCHCCNGSPAPPRPKKTRQKKPSIDFNN